MCSCEVDVTERNELKPSARSRLDALKCVVRATTSGGESSFEITRSFKFTSCWLVLGLIAVLIESEYHVKVTREL